MKLLVTGAWKCTEEQLDVLHSLGHKIIFLQNEKDSLPCDYEEVEGVICNALFLHHPIEKFKSLRYIQLTSAGFDRVSLDYVNACGIEIHNARGVYSIPMAEFAVCGVLQIYKKAALFCESQKKKEWKKQHEVLELHGKTVCIVGCGSVGTECAKRFAAFGCRVIGVDIFPPKSDWYEKTYLLSELDNCLAQSDVVILTLPLTSETKHMMNEARFEAMKQNSVIVNIARGAIVKENALLDALDRKLMGAVCDVFEDEPLAESSALWEKENVIITPHNSFVGDGNSERLWKVIYGNLEKAL